MNFDLDYLTQSIDLEREFKVDFYQKIAVKAKNSERVYLTGFGIGLISGLFTIASRVTQVFESAIKGVIDIFGSPFTDKCQFVRGFAHLVFVPLSVIQLPFSILSAVCGVFDKTVRIYLEPIGYPKEKVKTHKNYLEKKMTYTNLKIQLSKIWEDAIQLTKPKTS